MAVGVRFLLSAIGELYLTLASPLKGMMKIHRVWLGFALLILSLSVACNGLAANSAPTAATVTLIPRATSVPTVAQEETATSSAPSGLGKLAYVQGGDIWVRSLPDGEPQQLTTDDHNQGPRWSPSGEWLAFWKTGSQVWLMRADGSDARPLTDGLDVPIFAWAPTMDRLAYVTDGGELHVVDADGAYSATLVSAEPDQGGVGHIAWSPDGMWIAYEWWEQRSDSRRYQGLWKVSPGGGDLEELYDSGVPERGEAILARWSDDGRFLIFWQGPVPSASILADGVPLYVLSTDGGAPAQLPETVLLHPDFIALDPADADRVAVVAGGYRGSWTNKMLRLIRISAGESVAITAPDEAVSSPAWSPDGRRIAYVAMPDEGDLGGGDAARQGLMGRCIWVAAVEGDSPARPLADDPVYRDEYPLWSAEGSHILFVRMDAEDSVSLWLVPAGGGEPSLVVDGLEVVGGLPSDAWLGYYGYVDWQPLFDWWR
jgi:Tol biopolymer transport system component